jgi:hypothetical protein
MTNEEAVGNYFSRVMDNVGQQRALEKRSPKVVEKVLWSLSTKFDYVIPSIEVVYDLSAITPVKLMGLLLSQEERMNGMLSGEQPTKPTSNLDEHALQVVQEQNKSPNGRGHGWATCRTRSMGRGRGTFDRNKVPQCYTCKKYGHLKKDFGIMKTIKLM